MRHNIGILIVIVALCTVHGAEAVTQAEQLVVSRAITLAETASPQQLKQAVNSGVDFNVQRHPDFDSDDPYFGYWEDDYNFEYMTPLHAAATKNHDPKSIRYLLSLGLEVNASAAAGNTIHDTPLTCAIRNKNNIQVISELLNAGASPVVWNSGNNYSALHLAAFECKSYPYAKAVIDALLKAGCDIDSHYQFTREEKQELMEQEDPSAFRIKWSRDDPFGVSNLSHIAHDSFLSSFTPLMYAVLHNNPDAVNILLDAGADPNIRSFEGKTALDYARMLPKTTSLRRSDAFIRLQKVSRTTKTPRPENESGEQFPQAYAKFMRRYLS
ncbi:MAG: ankyrin repeat domain-containing protein [Synergistaceae bacterium]|nr:ankyrin repeat domain-containing protein [Synergistaceae bacterium]